jgi:SPP1 gp7 family putative phage head morphogenesis protein
MSGDAMATALYDEMSIALSAGWISAKDVAALAVDISAGFDTIPSWALQAMRDDIDAFAFMVNEREQKTLFNTIDQAVAQGMTPKDLATDIASVFAEGYHVLSDQGDVVRMIPTDDWSEAVARTELSRAQTMGALALYKEAKIEKVTFITTQGANVCPECEVLDGETFAVADLEDDNTPPIHPNCCCALTPADEDVAYESEAT